MCDGRGTPFEVITTAANVNDVTQTLALVDGSRPWPASPAGRGANQTPCSVTGLRQQSQPPRAAQAPDPAGDLPQGRPEHQGPGQAPLRR
ncbi:hypothetical protein ACFY3M_44705 [Streptomyces mirabilis]|uniref:hypothetical protein n=1 Tax=Streptomyces mirabilis TaxID=68239 RepID=UPI0036CBBF97